MRTMNEALKQAWFLSALDGRKTYVASYTGPNDCPRFAVRFNESVANEPNFRVLAEVSAPTAVSRN